MAQPKTPLTELEAVNLMLDVIGEDAVSSLDTSGLPDAARARTTLNTEMRAFQEEEWNWNTDEDRELSVDGNGEFVMGANVIRQDPSDKWVRGVWRGGKLWNKREHSFNWRDDANTDKLDFTIVKYYQFGDMPPAARRYVALRAARVFQKHTLGEEVLDKFTAEDELQARIAFTSADQRQEDTNLFTEYRARRRIGHR